MNKKIAHTFIMIFALGVSCIGQNYAQNYIPMINDSIYWDVAYRVNDPNPCAIFGVSGPKRYLIGNDTIVNGTTYKQFIGFDFEPYSPSGCPPFYIDTIPQLFDFYIREDTTTQRVYRFNTTSQLDELLFDFSLQQHDSIFLPSSISPNTYFYVDTLYTIVTTDGVSRRYFECFPRPNQGTTGGYLIEGLGGAMGPFERPYHVFEEGYWLLCISDLNESPVYGTTGLCFNFTTDIPYNEEIVKYLNIYPIPSSESINIESIPLNSSIVIVNTLGKVVQNKMALSERSINISNFEPGVYILIIETDNKISRATFVKQ